MPAHLCSGNSPLAISHLRFPPPNYSPVNALLIFHPISATFGNGGNSVATFDPTNVITEVQGTAQVPIFTKQYMWNLSNGPPYLDNPVSNFDI